MRRGRGAAAGAKHKPNSSLGMVGAFVRRHSPVAPPAPKAFGVGQRRRVLRSEVRTKFKLAHKEPGE
jgi:hypothetical protein